jgi:flagellar hook-associated protein 2
VGLRFDPVGGGQFQQAIKVIVEAERQPIKQLETRKTREEAKQKLFQEFKGKFQGFDKTLSEFTNFKNFRELKVDLGDGASFVNVTVDKDKAQPGSYTLQVDQLAQRSSVISNGFSNPDDPVLGIGFVVANMANGDSAEIFVDEDNASLRGIANLINSQSKSPIRASVVKDGSDPEKPWRLIMTAKQDGADDGVQFPDFYFLDGKEDFYVSDENEAQNAVIMLDGFPIEAQGNDINDFLEGVNLHLKQARPDQPITITISEDHQKVAGKVKGLIDQVNGILSFINQQNKVDEKSDTRTTFAGDTTLQTIEYRMRNLMHEGFPVGDPNSEDFHFKFLNQMGVEFGKDGLLTFKEEKFQKVLEADFNGVTEAITGDYGFAAQLKQVIAGAEGDHEASGLGLGLLIAGDLTAVFATTEHRS